MCDCFTGSINSHDKKAASKPLPELEYIPLKDSFVSSSQFKAKLKRAKDIKHEPYSY